MGGRFPLPILLSPPSPDIAQSLWEGGRFPLPISHVATHKGAPTKVGSAYCDLESGSYPLKFLDFIETRRLFERR